jgi:uncharacterized membrane protein
MKGSRNMTVTYPTSVPRVAPERVTNSRVTNSYASAALAFSMVGAVVLSVILAIAALCQVKNPGEGRGQAIAGLAVSAGWIVLLFALARAHVI